MIVTSLSLGDKLLWDHCPVYVTASKFLCTWLWLDLHKGWEAWRRKNKDDCLEKARQTWHFFHRNLARESWDSVCHTLLLWPSRVFPRQSCSALFLATGVDAVDRLTCCSVFFFSSDLRGNFCVLNPLACLWIKLNNIRTPVRLIFSCPC